MDDFTKQPYEAFTISADFTKNFSAGETISSQTVTALNDASDDVTATVTEQASIGNDGAGTVHIIVKDGLDTESPYKLTFRCVTSSGHKWELDVAMKVEEM